jgi:hypothetical protein
VRGLVLTIVVAVAIPPAHADDLEDARREFTAGQDADTQRDWQTAIAHYLRANELRPHPFAVYNIAKDYEQLAQLREAVRWYQQYLRVAAADAPERAKVEKLIGQLRVRPSKLAVRSSPDAARVLVDGTQVGVTPYAGVATAGTHRIVVDKDGLRDEREVALEYGEPADVAFTLGATRATGANGTLVVTGPPGAVVAVDGMAAGIVPLQLAIAPGAHAVHVQAYGYQPYDARPIVPAAGVANVDAPMIRGATAGFGGTRTNIALIGAAAGDIGARSGNADFLGEIGVRIGRFDTLIGLGAVAGGFAFDTSIRFSLFAWRVTPFVSGDFFAGSSGVFSLAVQAAAGLRWDIARRERTTISLYAGAGYRAGIGGSRVAGGPGAPPPVPTDEFPIMVSLEIAYRYVQPTPVFVTVTR